MKYFFDTEFLEDGRTIGLISIGIVAEDGREYYAISDDFEFYRLARDEWMLTNVVPSLPVEVFFDGDGVTKRIGKRESPYWRRRDEIAAEILEFIGDDKPEWWAYYCSYDWVALCQLFGKMIDLPKGWPKYCLDIKQLAVSLGNPKLPAKDGNEHHALADARWNKKAWEFLDERSIGGFMLGGGT